MRERFMPVGRAGYQQEKTLDQVVKAFFERFERANLSSDVPSIGNLYADTFLFAGPNGVQAVKKEDFLRVIPKMKTHFASLGLVARELQSVESSAIDPHYLLAKTAWRMTVQKSGDRTQIDAFATYILQRTADSLTIVVQIDHQDLATAIQNCG
jgi:ketosteroid isomerase-like protein